MLLLMLYSTDVVGITIVYLLSWLLEGVCNYKLQQKSIVYYYV